MNREKLLFEHHDNQGNKIFCFEQKNGDKVIILHAGNFAVEHTVANGSMRIYVNKLKEFDGIKYAEFYFFPIRDSHATLVVERGNYTHVVPYHVMLQKGTFLGHPTDLLDKKIYFPLEILKKY